LALLLSESELVLCLYLHEHAVGFDAQHAVKAAVLGSLFEFGCDDLYARSVAMLHGQGLIGLPRAADPRHAPVYLTLQGELTLRKVEQQLQAQGFLPPSTPLTLSLLMSMHPRRCAFLLQTVLEAIRDLKEPRAPGYAGDAAFQASRRLTGR